MCKLKISSECITDLSDIKMRDRVAGIYIRDLLYTLNEDKSALRKMLRDGEYYLDETTIDFKQLKGPLRTAGVDIRRIKAIDIPSDYNNVRNYRIIYAIDCRNKQEIYRVLGVMERGNNYDFNSDFFQRIFDQYDDIGLWRG